MTGERGPGRPEVGQPINVRLGDELLARVDARAADEGISRAELIRRLVSAGLARQAEPAARVLTGFRFPPGTTISSVDVGPGRRIPVSPPVHLKDGGAVAVNEDRVAGYGPDGARFCTYSLGDGVFLLDASGAR